MSDMLKKETSMRQISQVSIFNLEPDYKPATELFIELVDQLDMANNGPNGLRFKNNAK